MKKRMSFMSLLFGIVFLTACGNSDGNLIDTGSLTEGSWMGYDGEAVENEEMMTTESIDYDPATTYEINRSSYVSYFNGEEFIETIQYSDDPPMTLDTVEEADSIHVSFNQYNEDTISLTEAE
ncbi:hypothetical protein [Jeotgalicoccus sp. ATCC 8456]|uniref:hypothetical protein n=1 Tax=Jeotgalicoccus sp. ATCC 8456 TaxID=946435 RepID=UPI0018E63C07|nr:hypothetical protein [Jeotgalicoccus sp. ATCC 8456]QQD85646.1 hypothetical protein JEM45_03210 [Jeotgalicoccus sp. ATCC 8456]